MPFVPRQEKEIGSLDLLYSLWSCAARVFAVCFVETKHATLTPVSMCTPLLLACTHPSCQLVHTPLVQASKVHTPPVKLVIQRLVT